MRKMITAFVALFVLASGLIAGEVRGRVTKVDAEKGTITVSVGRGADAKMTTYKVAKDAKFTQTKDDKEEEIKDGLKSDVFKAQPRAGGGGGGGRGRGGVNVILTTEGEGDKEV